MKTLLIILISPLFTFSQSVKITDFGAMTDGSADCTAAFNAALNSLPPQRTAWGIPAYGQGTIEFPRGIYRFDSPIEIRTTVTLAGTGSGLFPYQETQLRFMGTAGIRIIADTKGYGARGVTLRNMYLRNFGASTDSTADGVWTNTKCIIDNISVDNFGGNGFAFVTNDSGNANNSMMINCTAYYNAKNGLFLSGNESNNISIYSSDFSANGMCGVLDNSFLGNNYFSCHVSFNGVRTATGYSKSWCTYNGKVYQAIKYPSHINIEPTVNANWKNYWVENNTVFNTVSPAQWNKDSVYYITAAYAVTGTAATSSFMSSYSEGGQGKSIMNEFSICYGGDHGAGFAFNKNLWLHQSASRLLLHGAGFKSYQRDSTQTFFGFDEAFGIVTGSEKANHSQTQLIYSEADRTTNLFNDNSTNNLAYRIVGKGYNASRLGLSSLPRTGRMIIPYYQGLGFESTANGNISRALYGTTTTPPASGTSYAIGDFILYMGSDTTIIGYRCISISPLTWKTLKAAN